MMDWWACVGMATMCRLCQLFMSDVAIQLVRLISFSGKIGA
jgi:hypothetical protein